MTTPTTGTSTLTRPDVEIDPTTGEPRSAHLVAPKDGKEGHVLIMEARIEGTAVLALCGHKFVPSRDPGNYPNCQACIEIFKTNTGADDGFRDS